MHYTSREVYEDIRKESDDPIVERRTCRASGKPFPIYQSDAHFYKKIRPTVHWIPYDIPFPTLCPEERSRRRMSWKNDHNYFRRRCDLTGEPIISIYHPTVPGPVYKGVHRRSDAWNAKEFWITYDENKRFLDQWKELYNTVPKIAMVNDNGSWSENCEYCQNIAYSKDCYLNTVSRKLENCYYSSNMATGERLIDSFFTMDSKICYECIEGHNLHSYTKGTVTTSM